MEEYLDNATCLKGMYKSFGEVGPVYQVGDIITVLNDGDSLIEITIVESSERTEYRLSKILKDPDVI
jgi:hypothetical protein